VSRLFVLVALVMLLTSRVMLLVHEFVGHGLVAVLCGGHVTGWFLFLFAGGRVSYDIEGLSVGQRLCVSLGGITLQLVLGTMAIVFARRRPAGSLFGYALLCAGAIAAGHGGVYLARGVHYGFGDGALLGWWLGGGRWIVVLLASATTVAVAYAGGLGLAELPASLARGSAWRIAAVTVLLFAGAGLVHGALAWVEIHAFPDPAWVAVMEEAAAAEARAEVERRVAAARFRGETVPSTEEQQKMLDAIEREHRPWPLDPFLAVAVVGAFGAGLFRAARRRGRLDAHPPTWRSIGGVAVSLVVACGAILLLRWVGTLL
jgi:hypothetical protein